MTGIRHFPHVMGLVSSGILFFTSFSFVPAADTAYAQEALRYIQKLLMGNFEGVSY